MRVTCGDCVVDTGARELRRSGESIPLSPKAFELLLILLECRPTAVSKRALQDRLWPNTFVVEKNLTNLIAEIRKAIGDQPAAPRFIRTVQRFGYAWQDSSPSADRETVRPANETYAVRLSWSGGRATLGVGEHLLGRGPDASVRLDSPGVSRHHALIRVAGMHATLEDLGSKNGTAIGTSRISTVTRLVDGDRIRIGSVVLTLRIVGPVDSTRTEPIPA